LVGITGGSFQFGRTSTHLRLHLPHLARRWSNGTSIVGIARHGPRDYSERDELAHAFWKKAPPTQISKRIRARMAKRIDV
jgi:hypothetical protein